MGWRISTLGPLKKEEIKMSMIERAKIQLDNAIKFSKSYLRTFIENMVAQDLSYFTEAKIAEINEFLGKSDWKLISKNQICYFENGVLTYWVGKVFDIDDDIKCLKAEYEYEIEQEKEYQEQIEYLRKFWKDKLSKISRDELINILVEFDMRDYE
jgi:hypothetical protein